jgi:hypothetical protein
VEANTALAARDGHADRPLLAWSRHQVRLGILAQRRLALAGAGASRPRRSSVLYIQLLIRELTGVELDPGWADSLAVGALALAALLGGLLNIRDLRRGRLQT